MEHQMSREELAEILKGRITAYRNFPKADFTFFDVFPIFHHPSLLDNIIDLFSTRISSHYPGQRVDMVVGVDSRGFLFAPELARRLQCDFIPARKKGKLPGNTLQKAYKLDYGADVLEIQTEYMDRGKTAVIVDDLIGTGGTMSAVHSLLKQEGLKVLECQCVVGPYEPEPRLLPDNCPLYCLVDFSTFNQH